MLTFVPWLAILPVWSAGFVFVGLLKLIAAKKRESLVPATVQAEGR